MSTYAIDWDLDADKVYETGIDHGVLFVKSNDGYGDAVAWSGLTAVTETPSGAEDTPLYADNIKYLVLKSKEDFGGTIEAYTYPDEWEQCDGAATMAISGSGGTSTPIPGVVLGQQKRKPFGLCYRTMVGTAEGTSDYKLHFVYNATASVSERSYTTVNDSPEAITFSWEFTTTPEIVEGFEPTSLVTVDTSKLDATSKGHLDALLAFVYGTAASGSSNAVPGKMPTPAQIASLLNTGSAA